MRRSSPSPLPDGESYLLSPASPDRYRTDRRTLRVDRFAARFIAVNGLAVIVAVFAIFLFILLETLPLFGRAEVSVGPAVATGVDDALLLGTDEWGQRPFLLGADGRLHFVDPAEGTVEVVAAPLPPGFSISSARYLPGGQEILLGGKSGGIVHLRIIHRTTPPAPDAEREVEADIELERLMAPPEGAGPVRDLDLMTTESRRTTALLTEPFAGSGRRVYLQVQHRPRSLFGPGAFLEGSLRDLTPLLPGNPRAIRLAFDGDGLVVWLDDHSVAYLQRDPAGDWKQTQVFRPFAAGEAIAAMNFLQGHTTLCLVSENGSNRLFTLAAQPGGGLRFIPTVDLPPLSPEPAYPFAASQRNKAFLIAAGRQLSLRYATTAEVRWSQSLSEPVRRTALGARYDHFFVLDRSGQLHACTLHDPHPEGGLKASFTRLWYEGRNAPSFTWQSTGGTDDFEPKLSLLPLVVGSLKGTLYALLLAVPIAFLAAIYTAQFMRPGLKRVVKPTMELMASLPSVVLGFIGALWLAPLLEDRMAALLLAVVTVPLVAILAGVGTARLPHPWRHRVAPGSEVLYMLPLLLATGWACWHLGPGVEQLLFAVTDPVSGERVADFRLWWNEHAGSDLQQRNALIVGIMMGFAVIPVIFTIAEDALANVPRSLVSGSLALGASRWDTTARVVLPTASSGLFSALMIGVGRAMGETMILVMATGNTPIMNLDLFSGMRTLSANLAIELPEAPYGGTLYRSLLFGALLLFALTFVINTFAEILRDRLRRRYAHLG